ncbi:DUF4350 domain-containing protein [Microbacterium sp. ZW T5_45]|uniref:DUF4350 domain-containing protein n=1 Tax=Microbacterium sp. ZW T5_45 TaxID=3378080 RepID=UPI003852397A
MTDVAETVIPASTAERPARRARLMKIGGWVVVAAILALGTFIAGQFTVSTPVTGALDPESVGDTGSRAIAEVLRDQGVDIEVYRSREQARAALDDDTTLVLTNPATLTDDALDRLLEKADRVVFLSASAHLLEHLGLGSPAPVAPAPGAARCDVPEFAEVGTIRADRGFLPDDGVEGCFGQSDSTAVLVSEQSGTRVSVVDGIRLFSNSSLTENGNAALAVALLGQTGKVAWYVPSFDDTDIDAVTADALGDLTPPWVTPAILLLILAGGAAALWRGQRFGPLVAETLPVTVRASETMHGRARLTAKAADSSHAAQALRDGSRRRLARRLGLAVNASGDEIADAAADRLRVPRGSLQVLLDGPLPSDDSVLIAMARQLGELETAVERSAPTPGRES